MKTIHLLLFASLPFTQLAKAQTQTCASFNTSSTALNRLQPSNTAEHSSGLHSWGITPVFGCTYSHGNSANCDTECTVTSLGATSLDPIGGFLSVETGGLTSAGTHQVSGSWNPGDSKAFGGGASCSGTVAGGAANCFTVPFTNTCFVSVSISAGGVTINTNGTTVWNSGPVPAPATCPAHPDPQATPTPPPPPQPTPTPGCASLPPASTADSPSPSFGPIANFTVPPVECDPSDPTMSCPCTPTNSPIIVDLTGDGFFLTSAANGVKFDIANSGTPIQIAWTANANNAFLVLDRNGNGVINSGAEMFGNFTPQPSSTHPNGFLALAVYDDPMNGGNGDGVIDARDTIFSSLRLWVDANHDGISQPDELHTLPELGIYSISLDYVLSERKDQYGNLFRYRARLNQGLHGPADVGKTAYDVFLVTQ